MSTFCKFLRQGLHFNNNKNFSLQPCCFFGKRYDIDIKNNIADQHRLIKNQWLKEDYNETCKICIDHEKLGVHSYRQASFEIIPDSAEKVSMIEVALDKQCNLACPQCGSYNSSFWHNENKRNGMPEKEHIVSLHSKKNLREINSHFVSLFDNEIFSELKYVKFSGGEPLMSDLHLKILEKIRKKDNVELHYTSNFSIMPSQKVFEMWKNFKVVKWMASIDGTADQFSLLRWPYNWVNLLEFCELAEKITPDNVVLAIEHTLNMLNIFYYDRMEEWYQKEFCKNAGFKKGVLNMHNVSSRLTLQEVPYELREKICKKFGEEHKISKIISSQGPQVGYNNSVRYLDLLDKQRKTNWRLAFPEVEGYYV
jgi:organic radical activating enzyme